MRDCCFTVFTVCLQFAGKKVEEEEEEALKRTVVTEVQSGSV